ncbi:MAG: penicillin acylase family protein, partial [Pirellulales bacterium]
MAIVSIVAGSRIARGEETGDTANADRPSIAHAAQRINSDDLARRVTIRRDAFGIAHIEGETDASVLFGFAYVQAEDFFWQVEDTYILALGRYAEVHGPRGLNSDLLNRAFEVVPRSKADFAGL